MTPVLYDAVTLRHFAAVGQLDLLRKQHGDRPPPRWTEEIREEIARAVKAGVHYCKTILKAGWLGDPAAPKEEDLSQIVKLQIAINKGNITARGNHGEAECIYFAAKHQGRFATDDNGAYEFARLHSWLGSGRVIDSIDILRYAVILGHITATNAARIADDMERQGRRFRPVHRRYRGPDYFLADHTPLDDREDSENG